MSQEDVYQNDEADSFFLRNIEKVQLDSSYSLRKSKISIYNTLTACLENTLNGSRVLEIGCFVGDLLAKLATDHQCSVNGIEPSGLACGYAQEHFKLELENCTFDKSRFFGLTSHNRSKFDLIIIDDVLSWMSRDMILPALASIDWLTSEGGHVFIRDFSPMMDFAYPNHHQTDKDVWNYKVSGGHKKFFINTGTYLTVSSNTKITNVFQNAESNRPDSMLWNDSVLMKITTPLQPRLDYC